MGRYIQMVVVLAGFALLSGLSLGGLNELTFEKAQNNILRFKKIPAVANIFEMVSGKLDPEARGAVEEALLTEKRFLDLGEGEPELLFVVRKDGAPFAVALERFGSGFGGALGVMVGFKLETGDLVGVGITTLSETPGVGTRVLAESFTLQFRDMKKDTVFKVKKDGGQIDAISGATVSSRAVAEAIEAAHAFYQAHQDRIKAVVKE